MDQTKEPTEPKVEPQLQEEDTVAQKSSEKNLKVQQSEYKNGGNSATKGFVNPTVNFSDKPTFTQKLNSQNFISIDIDSDNIKYILGSVSGKNIFVRDTGISMIPEGESNPDKALKLTLDNIKTNVYKSGYRIHVGFYSPDVTIRQYQLPYMRKTSELTNAIYYKLQSDSPGFNENSIWRYKVLDDPQKSDSKTQRVVVLVTPGSVIHKYVHMLDSAGLKPETLVCRSVAVAKTFNRMVDSSSADIVVDLSYDVTHICFTNNGSLEYTRNLSTGASNLEVAVHDKKGKILGEDVFHLKEEEGISKNGALRPQMIRKALQQRLRSLQAHQNPVLQLFKNELQHSVEHFDSLDKNKSVKRIFLTGYGLQKESLLSFLKNNMKTPVFALSPRLSDESEDVFKSARYFSTLGTIVDTKDPFNLVPKEFRTQLMFKRFNFIVSILLILTILTMTYLTGLTYQNIDDLNIEFDNINKKYEELNPIEIEYQRLNNDIKNIRSDQNSFKNIIKTEGPVLEILRLISNETPEQIILMNLSLNHSNSVVLKSGRKGRKNRNKTTANKNDANSYSIKLVGTVNGDYLMSDVILINYIDHLKNLDYFKTIEIFDKNKKNVKQRMQFEIRATL